MHGLSNPLLNPINIAINFVRLEHDHHIKVSNSAHNYHRPETFHSDIDVRCSGQHIAKH